MKPVGKSTCQKGPGKTKQWMDDAQALNGMSLLIQHGPELTPICVAIDLTGTQKENTKKCPESTETQH